MRLSKRAKSHPSAQDQQKESLIKELAGQIEAAGFKVRREKLKAGPGWKTVSGSCRVDAERLIFVDRKSALDDQILFLQSTAQQLGLDLSLRAASAEDQGSSAA